MAVRRTAPALAPDTSSVTETAGTESDATDVPVVDETDGVPSLLETAQAAVAEASHRERLRAIPVRWAVPPESWIGKLPKPTSKNAPKGKCLPRSQGGEAPDWQDHYCGGWHGLPAVHLDFVGHADTTLALIEVDPEWNLEMGWESTTGPIDAFAFTSPAEPTQLLCRMTVLGVTRPCVGTTEGWKGSNAFKELLGDAIRNGAMRFGIGTGLWSKSDRDDVDSEAASTSSASSSVAAAPLVMWPYRMLKAKALEMVQANGLEPAKDIAREMWDLVVPVTHPEDEEFNPDQVNRYCADFAEWLGSQGDPSDSAEDVPDGPDPAWKEGAAAFIRSETLDGEIPDGPADEQLIDSGEALR